MNAQNDALAFINIGTCPVRIWPSTLQNKNKRATRATPLTHTAALRMSHTGRWREGGGATCSACFLAHAPVLVDLSLPSCSNSVTVTISEGRVLRRQEEGEREREREREREKREERETETEL